MKFTPKDPDEIKRDAALLDPTKSIRFGRRCATTQSKSSQSCLEKNLHNAAPTTFVGALRARSR
jgi:hypothetical protein